MLLGCSPNIPWAEPPPRLISARKPSLKRSTFLFYGHLPFFVLFKQLALQRPPQPWPCWRECNSDLQWVSFDSGEGADAQWHIQAFQNDVLRVVAVFLFSFFRDRAGLCSRPRPPISPRWNLSCHISQEELINIPQNTLTIRTCCPFFTEEKTENIFASVSCLFCSGLFFLHHY